MVFSVGEDSAATYSADVMVWKTVESIVEYSVSPDFAMGSFNRSSAYD